MTTVPNFAFVLAGIAGLLICDPKTNAQGAEPALRLEAKIGLGEVRGRIDHLAFDPGRGHLFVAELGNNSVAVVDLTKRETIRLIEGLKEPQGVAYEPSTDTVYVANAGDGSLRMFDAGTFEPTGRLDLGDDADNIRVDAERKLVFVGYGNGGLAVVDPTSRSKIADISLKAHPEGFQLAPSGDQIFVNVPSSKEIAVVDRVAGRQAGSWPLKQSGNFPMSLDEDGNVVVAFRSPPRLGVLSAKTGAAVATAELCSDADDVFVDRKRRRAYVSCGDGFLDVFDTRGDAYQRVEHVATAPRARTSYFASELDLLLVAVPKSASEAAAIWVFRPAS